MPDVKVLRGTLADAAIRRTLLVASSTWRTFWGRMTQAAPRTRPFGRDGSVPRLRSLSLEDDWVAVLTEM